MSDESRQPNETSAATPVRTTRHRTRRSISPLVERLGPPISSVAWSPNTVAQTLEILPVGLRVDGLFWLKPIHAESLRVGLPRAAKPGDVVLGVMRWYPLTPRVVHSTSWRYEADRIILTYVAVVAPPAHLPPDSLVSLPVGHVALARGEAMAPPTAIGVAQVVEHALRHLSWLVRDDPAIAAALREWTDALADYQPEPFRALG